MTKKRANAQFRLRHLLAATLLVALVLATFAAVGHLVIFAGGVVLASLSLWPVIRPSASMSRRLAVLPVFLLSWVLLYVLSFGPASWLLARYNTVDTPRAQACHLYRQAYWRLATAIIYSPPWVRQPAMWYVGNGMPRGTVFHAVWSDGMGWTTHSRVKAGKALTFTVVSY